MVVNDKKNVKCANRKNICATFEPLVQTSEDAQSADITDAFKRIIAKENLAQGH